MKKTLIALAAVAASGVALAQNVTLSGTISASYQKDLSNGAATGNVAAKGLVMTDAAFKVTATEDLGGGLKATADFAYDGPAARGGNATRADGGISVSGGFGTVAYRNTRTSDLIASIGSSAVALPDGVYDTGVGVRGAVDVLAYSLPSLVKGLTLGVSYVEGNDGNLNVPAGAGLTKSAYVLTGSYGMGPLTLTAQAKRNSVNDGGVAATRARANQLELSATYDAGVARIAVAHDGRESDSRGTGLGASVTVPLGAFSVGANYFKREDTKMTEFGARYELSKRTNFMASVGRIADRSNAAGTIGSGENGNQYRLRLSHSF